MNSAYLLGITVILFFFLRFDWRQLDQTQKKEKYVMCGIYSAVWIAVLWLTIFPDSPGFFTLVDRLFKPFGVWFEQF